MNIGLFWDKIDLYSWKDTHHKRPTKESWTFYAARLAMKQKRPISTQRHSERHLQKRAVHSRRLDSRWNKRDLFPCKDTAKETYKRVLDILGGSIRDDSRSLILLATVLELTHSLSHCYSLITLLLSLCLGLSLSLPLSLCHSIMTHSLSLSPIRTHLLRTELILSVIRIHLLRKWLTHCLSRCHSNEALLASSQRVWVALLASRATCK